MLIEKATYLHLEICKAITNKSNQFFFCSKLFETANTRTTQNIWKIINNFFYVPTAFFISELWLLLTSILETRGVPSLPPCSTPHFNVRLFSDENFAYSFLFPRPSSVFWKLIFLVFVKYLLGRRVKVTIDWGKGKMVIVRETFC